MRGKKGQTVLDFVILFGLSLGLTLVTKLIFGDLIGFLLFLGWLFLIVSILGIMHRIELEREGLILSGSASAVFFFLSWLVPKLAVLKELFGLS